MAAALCLRTRLGFVEQQRQAREERGGFFPTHSGGHARLLGPGNPRAAPPWGAARAPQATLPGLGKRGWGGQLPRGASRSPRRAFPRLAAPAALRSAKPGRGANFTPGRHKALPARPVPPERLSHGPQHPRRLRLSGPRPRFPTQALRLPVPGLQQRLAGLLPGLVRLLGGRAGLAGGRAGAAGRRAAPERQPAREAPHEAPGPGPARAAPLPARLAGARRTEPDQDRDAPPRHPLHRPPLRAARAGVAPAAAPPALPAARPAAGGVLARRSRLPELQTRRPSRRRAPPGRAARRAPVARLPESPRRAALLPGGLLPAGGSRPGLTQPRSPAAAAAEEAPRARRTERRALWADWQRPPEGPRAGTGFRAGPERLTGSGGPLALRGAARPGEDKERPPAERVPGRPSGR